MKKRIVLLPVMIIAFTVLMASAALAAGYSSAWFQENGTWKVKGPDGQTLKNCWFCDDAIFENAQNVWYLLDANGNMISNPLVRDSRGNYYSLETEHNGTYGSLRYLTGNYDDDIYMVFSQNHDGTFGALTNQKAIDRLKDWYGVTDINIDSNNCVYSSSWLGKTADPAASAQTGLGPGGSGETTPDNVLRTITYYNGNKKLGTDSGYTRYFTVRNCTVTGFICWGENAQLRRWYPGDMYYFEGNQTGAHFSVVTWD